ncbi:MAG: tetratricopeptide repeat protein [Leptolyngbya sp. SIO3F4]|nr:tetratricopeptide repeat protein [Leptolyngbya sp. SIO3F4]
MEIAGDGWIVLIVALTILSTGGVAIAVTTLQPLGQNVPFFTPITDLSIPISGEARHQFNCGVLAYREKSYAKAIECFTKVLDFEPTLAEAFHNKARAMANLAKHQDAAAYFIAASDIYNRQGTKTRIEWVKADLNILMKL